MTVKYNGSCQYIYNLSIKKKFLKPYVNKAGIAVYTEIASTHNTDV